MTLKELRISKKLTQEKASIICNIPLRTYKRIEGDISYVNSVKYKDAFKCLNEYQNKAFDKHKPYKIVIVGAGYVGYSLGILLSEHNDVSIIDIDVSKVDKINEGIPLFDDFKDVNNVKAYLPDINRYKECDYVVIAVPTNYVEETHKLDVSVITSIINDIRSVNKKCIIVIKSTVNIGYIESLNDKRVIFIPEFLREKYAYIDSRYPSRIIIGCDNTSKEVKIFTKLLLETAFHTPKTLYMASKEAEAVKLCSNAYLALRVAYFNEIDTLSFSLDMDSHNVIQGISLDPRIGDYYNTPSFGYGGYCLPKDTKSLESNMDSDSLISSISRSNDKRINHIVNDIASRIDSNSIIGIYDIGSRYSVVITISKRLKELGYQVILASEMDIDIFKSKSDLIVIDRYSKALDDIKEKVYTKDLKM